MAEEIAYARIARTEVVWVEGVINFEQKRAFCSIYVTGFRAKTKPADLIVHFRDTKNGGGDIDKVIFNKRGGAVIIFHNPEGKIFMADWPS